MNTGFSTGVATAAPKKVNKRRINWAPYLFVAPYVILIAAFSLYPYIFSFFISFHKWNGVQPMEYVGLQNYIRMFKDGTFITTLKNISIIMVILIPIQITLGLVLAYAANSKLTRFKNVFRTAIFTPYLTIPIAAGLMWGFVFDKKLGFINYILENLGLIKDHISFIGDPVITRLVIVLLMLWRYIGYTMVMFMAGLITIPEEIYEAAKIDGAKSWQILFKISIPMIKPIMTYLIITSVIGCLGTFDEPTMLYSNSPSESFDVGGPESAGLTMVMSLIYYAFSMGQFGYGSAISYVLFGVILVFSGITGLILRRGDKDE